MGDAEEDGGNESPHRSPARPALPMQRARPSMSFLMSRSFENAALPCPAPARWSTSTPAQTAHVSYNFNYSHN
eukprot:4115933-Pyramimonas_sp.AAC.1